MKNGDFSLSQSQSSRLVTADDKMRRRARPVSGTYSAASDEQSCVMVGPGLHFGWAWVETDRISFSFSFSAPKLQIFQFRTSFVFGIFVFRLVSFSAQFRFRPIIIFGAVRN